MKRGGPLRRRSKKRAAQEREYSAARRAALAGQLCEAKWETCTHRATEVHHARGRVGADLLDRRYWRYLCHNCHMAVEANPHRASQCGLKYERNGQREDNQ